MATHVFGMKPRPEYGEKRKPTPIGEKCLLCDEAIVAGDMGEWTGHVAADGEIVIRPAHLECCLRSVIGGLNHLRGLCTCCGGDQPPDPAEMSPRQAAIAAAQFYWKNKQQETLN